MTAFAVERAPPATLAAMAVTLPPPPLYGEDRERGDKRD